MKAIIVNLLKGFWRAKGKLFLCIAAAALSTWGISTIIYSYFFTERDFTENFLKTNPADIILSIEAPQDALLKAIINHDDVLMIERRETMTGRIRNQNGNWMSLVVFAAENIEQTRINSFEISDRRVNGNTGFLIERNGIGFLNEKPDSLSVQFPGLDESSVLFSGTVYDPGQAPSQMEQALYAYTTIKNIEGYRRTNTNRFLITTKKKSLNEFELRIIAQELINVAAAHGSKASFTIPPPGEHPHQGIVDGISFLQKSFGLILSLLGVILLSLILITWLYPQIVNIGIMKAIGASSQMVFQAYVVVVLMILAIGLAIGLPVGYKTGEWYNGTIAFIQNFNAIKRPLPLLNHALVVIPSIIIPVIFAIIPMRKAANTTVHDALNHIFFTPYQRIFKWTQESIRDTRWKYSLNNLFRNNQRTGLLMLLLISGIALFTTGSNLRYSLKKDFAAYANDSGYGITIILKDSSQTTFEFLEALPFVESVSYVNIRGVRYKLPHQSYEENSPMRTMAPDYEFNPARISRGTYNRNCSDCIYISQRYQADFAKIPFGDTVFVNFRNTREPFIYSGVVKDITHPGFYRFGKTPNRSFLEVAVKLRDGVSSMEATKLIDDALLNNNVDVRSVSDESTRLLALENHLKPMYLVIQVMGIVTIVIAMLGLLIVLNLSLRERAREMGIMKALGGTVRSIVNSYQREYIILTTLAIVLGSGVGYAFNAAICNLFGVMVINAPVPPLNDLTFALLAAMGLLSLQIIMISGYVRYKVKTTSGRLLTEVF